MQGYIQFCYLLFSLSFSHISLQLSAVPNIPLRHKTLRQILLSAPVFIYAVILSKSPVKRMQTVRNLVTE